MGVLSSSRCAQENPLTSKSELPDARQELFDSERRFRLLVEGVIDYAICMLDTEGRVTNWNAGARRIKGYEASEIIGQHFGIFYSPEERAAGKPEAAIGTARREGRFATEGWRVRKDGSRFLASVVIDAIHEHGELIGFAKITRDVTERYEAQHALQNSERHFRLLVSGVTDYALYMLDPMGLISSWNIGGERIKGYRPDEIIGQHFSRFYTEKDRANGKPQRALAIARDTGRYEEDGWRVRKDGSYFWASVVIDPIRDDHGEIIGFAKVTRDITERRNAQLAMEKMQKQLADSQKMDALGQLTGGVAHDFNNLLMVVSGNITKLKKLVADDPTGRRSAESIEIAARRGSALTRQLLTFSRRQRLNPETIDLVSRLDSIRDLLSTGLGSHVRLVVDTQNRVWPVTADPSELEVAIVNLVINARDAMPEGGTVTVSLGNVTLGDGEPAPSGDYVAVCVEDTGVGIPDDILQKVFDPFFTTKPPGKGTGLGLSQVYGFTHQAGGTVKVKSELGKGTKFTVYLPRENHHAFASPNHEDQRFERIEGQSGTILLVEDNPDVAAASSGILEELGYSVRWISSAEEALKTFNRDEADIVMSDIVMPGKIDGLGLARALRQTYPKLPILLTTGYSDSAITVRSEFPILPKPYELHELAKALSTLRRS